MTKPQQSVGGYLIYHRPRWTYKAKDAVVYHDGFGGHNQDPYLWNERFLHTYCHITQMSPKPGHINFWVSGWLASDNESKFPNFEHLWCDIVFVLGKDKDYRYKWNSANKAQDAIIDSELAYEEHYQFAEKGEHPFKKRPRFTLKADPQDSFQPQSPTGKLIDIVPWLTQHGYPLDCLQTGLTAGIGSKPMGLPSNVVTALYQELCKAECRLKGSDLLLLRPRTDSKEVQRPLAS